LFDAQATQAQQSDMQPRSICMTPLKLNAKQGWMKMRNNQAFL